MGTVLTLVGKRLLFAVPMLLLVSLFSFFLVSISPTDPARIILGPLATQEQVVAKRAELRLDDGMLTQYWTWLGGALHGDLGSSIIGGGSVTTQLNSRLGATVSLIAVAMVFVIVLGVGLGVVSALNRGAGARAIDLTVMLGLAIPAFWLALLLKSTFSIRLGWFPVSGYTYFSQDPLEWVRSLVLPAFAAALAGVAAVAKQTRSSMLDALSKDFVRVMQANGFSYRSIVFRHALRNAAIPVVTMTGVIVVSLLGSTVVIENLFGFPGLGSLAASAAGQHDLPLIQGAVLYFTLIVVVVGVLVDVSYALLDPRVRVR